MTKYLYKLKRCSFNKYLIILVEYNYIYAFFKFKIQNNHYLIILLCLWLYLRF